MRYQVWALLHADAACWHLLDADTNARITEPGVPVCGSLRPARVVLRPDRKLYCQDCIVEESRSRVYG